MRNKKQWFAERIAEHVLALIDVTYRVSYSYVSKNPQLSVMYDAAHHTLVVCIHGNERVIPLKQTRFNKAGTLSLFEDVRREIHDTYTIPDDGQSNEDLIEQTQKLCLKHIDLNRAAPMLDVSFTFRADDGVLTSRMQDRDYPAWLGLTQHRGTDVDYITVVDAHHSGYSHLSEEANNEYIEGYIYGQLRRLNGSLDSSLQIARNEPPAYADVSLLGCMDRLKHNVRTSVTQ